jgi:hypothetical protein
MMSRNFCGATPLARTRLKASPRLSITVASRKLRAIFTAFACACSAPTMNTCRASALNTGWQRSSASGGPAAITSSSPFAAAGGRPNTGADT